MQFPFLLTYATITIRIMQQKGSRKNMENEEQKQKRRKRVKRLKKMILATVALAILVPFLFSIVFGVQLHKKAKYISSLEKKVQMLLQENEKLQTDFDTLSEHFSRQEQSRVNQSDADPDPEKQTGEKMEFSSDAENKTGSEIPAEGIRKVYLTFDDGPSIYTDQILDVLKEYHVKATFFVVGKTEARYEAVYRRIVDEGHTLGMHSFSHKYNEIYASEEAFAADLEALRSFLKEKTGVECRFSRFPGGSSNTVSNVDMNRLITYLNEQGITYFDWNISSGDATSGYISKNRIIQNCTESLANYETAVILLHDSGEREETVKALPELIEKIQEMENTVLLPISEETKLIQHIKSESEE